MLSPVDMRVLIRRPYQPCHDRSPLRPLRRGLDKGVAMFSQCAYAMQAFFAQRWDIANTAA